MQAQPAVTNNTLISALVPRTGLVVDTALVVGFALLTALVAQIAIKFPGTPVPITGQTFAVLCTGAVLGSKKGALSMSVYMLMGMFLLPVFAPSSSFLGERTFHFIFPWNGTGGFIWDLSSGGYIVGFIIGAYVVGRLAELGWDRKAKVSLAMVIGNTSIYIFGLAWLGYVIAFQSINAELTYYDAIAGSNVLDKTLRAGLYPFIAGDALKMLLAGMVLPGAWALVDRVQSSKEQK